MDLQQLSIAGSGVAIIGRLTASWLFWKQCRNKKKHRLIILGLLLLAPHGHSQIFGMDGSILSAPAPKQNKIQKTKRDGEYWQIGQEGIEKTEEAWIDNPPAKKLPYDPTGMTQWPAGKNWAEIHENTITIGLVKQSVRKWIKSIKSGKNIKMADPNRLDPRTDIAQKLGFSNANALFNCVVCKPIPVETFSTKELMTFRPGKRIPRLKPSGLWLVPLEAATWPIPGPQAIILVGKIYPKKINPFTPLGNCNTVVAGWHSLDRKWSPYKGSIIFIMPPQSENQITNTAGAPLYFLIPNYPVPNLTRVQVAVELTYGDMPRITSAEQSLPGIAQQLIEAKAQGTKILDPDKFYKKMVEEMKPTNPTQNREKKKQTIKKIKHTKKVKPTAAKKTNKVSQEKEPKQSTGFAPVKKGPMGTQNTPQSEIPTNKQQEINANSL